MILNYLEKLFLILNPNNLFEECVADTQREGNMKRKLLCLIMALTLAFAGWTANADALDGTFDKIADKLAEFSSQDRENLMTIVYPFIAVDSGIDILVSMINNHSPNSDTMIDEYIAELLKYSSKEDIVFGLESLKIIPETVRKEYLGAFMNREELSLSEESNLYMTEFLKISYGKAPNLEHIFAEDKITNNIVAKLFKFIPAANDNMPLMSVNAEYEFSPYYISDAASAKWNALCDGKDGKKSIKEYVASLTQHFNAEYSTNFRTKLSVLFAELGICYIPTNDAQSFKNVVLSKNDRVSYPAIYVYFDNGKMLYRTEMADKDFSVALFADCDGWYRACVTELAYMGIVSGRGNGMFYPNDYVTREEFVKMICSAINLPSADMQIPFADVDNSAWYSRYIKSAYNYKIINGQSADIFGVGQYISRQDAAVICNNILKNINIAKNNNVSFGDAELIAPYATQSVYNLASTGIINGDDKGNFNPTSSITRAESAKIINELIYVIAKNAK